MHTQGCCVAETRFRIERPFSGGRRRQGAGAGQFRPLRLPGVSGAGMRRERNPCHRADGALRGTGGAGSWAVFRMAIEIVEVEKGLQPGRWPEGVIVCAKARQSLHRRLAWTAARGGDAARNRLQRWTGAGLLRGRPATAAKRAGKGGLQDAGTGAEGKSLGRGAIIFATGSGLSRQGPDVAGRSSG